MIQNFSSIYLKPIPQQFKNTFRVFYFSWKYYVTKILSLKQNIVLFLSTGFKIHILLFKSSVQFSSVAQSCLILCDPMDCSTPGLPVHHQLPEFTQTHVHCVSDAVQPSRPLLSPSPLIFNLSQHLIINNTFTQNLVSYFMLMTLVLQGKDPCVVWSCLWNLFVAIGEHIHM